MKRTLLAISLTFGFLATSFSQQFTPSLLWSKALGGSGQDVAASLVLTPDGGYVMAGSSQSNDGHVSGHHGSLNTTDGWVVKLSALGVIEWQRSLGGTGNDNIKVIKRTSDGHFICIGETESNDGDVSGYHGQSDMWVIKLSKDGSVLWQRALGGSSRESPGNVTETKDGGFYVFGHSDSNDGDVIGKPSLSNSWLVKLTSSGGIEWQKSLGGGMGVDVLEFGNNLLLGIVSSDDFYIDTTKITKISGRPFPSYIIEVTPSFQVVRVYKHGAVLKAFSAGYGRRLFNFESHSCFPDGHPGFQIIEDGTTPQSLYATDPSCGFNFFSYANASGSRSALLKTGGFVTVTSVQDPRIADGKGDEDGYLVGGSGSARWTLSLGGSSTDWLYDVTVSETDEIVAVGGTWSNDKNVSGNHGKSDFWIVKLGGANGITGSVFIDLDKNGTRSPNEPFVNNVFVESRKNDTIKYASLTALNGTYSNSVDSGTYVTKPVAIHPAYTVFPASRTSTFPGFGLSDNAIFALQMLPDQRDLAIALTSQSPIRPGFHTAYTITYKNNGTDTLVNGTIKLIKDRRLSFNSSSPVQSSSIADTITWNVASLPPMATGYIYINATAAAPPIINLRDTIISVVSIDSSRDLTVSDNISVSKIAAQGAYDPNDKQESRGGFVTTKELLNNPSLLYTIRFQNTGTDTAFTVVVRDTLQENVEWSSVEMLGASHDYKLNIEQGNILIWTFSNILLVDSNKNEPKSHGYINFKVTAKSGLNLGTQIKNSAAIYFDFNPPVITDTHVTLVVPPRTPGKPQLAGLSSTYCKEAGAQKVKLANLPANPLVNVTVKVNGSAVSVGADSSFTFNTSTLAIGSYSIVSVFTNEEGSDTTSYVFTVTAPVTPTVKLNTNITQVINLADPVVITASNTNGGTQPKYTFAKDRSMTTILQSESTTATLTLQPSALAVGTNWIYVSMKSNEKCAASEPVLDSIKIERMSITGLVDIDNPTKQILVYPNPVEKYLTLSNLNRSKKYVLTLTNGNGQRVKVESISGKDSYVFSTASLAKGVYHLSLFDVSKNRSIGTISVIRR